MTTINRRIGLAVALMLAAAVFAGEDDVLLAFSTTGPDRYADGSPVMEGEIYALVWTRAGATFAGVQADGALVNPGDSEIVMTQPNAGTKVVDGETVGYCRPTLFHIPAAFHAAHAGGRYEVVLLDTRATDASGVLRPAGRAEYVRGWCVVPERERGAQDAAASSAMLRRGAAPASGARTVASLLPPGVEIPQPRITAIKVEDGQVKLTFTGSSPLLLYSIAAGGTPAVDESVGAVQPVSGVSDAAAELEIAVPVREGQRFFKVVRNP